MQATSAEVEAQAFDRLARVRVFAMDVDGVLTNGVVTFSSDGTEQKGFHVADGLGLVALRPLDILVVWISGRQSVSVEKRAGELKIPFLLQGVRDKSAALRQFAQDHAFSAEAIAYLGDDWNDLLAFEAAGVRIAVANAAWEVRESADFVTLQSGGQGAVREVCEALMEARGARAECLAAYLDSLRSVVSSDLTAQ